MNDNEAYDSKTKGSVLQQDVTILNTYVHDVGPPKYMRHQLVGLQGKLDEFTLTMGDSSVTSG